MTTTSGEQMRPFYATAQVAFPILPAPSAIVPLLLDDEPSGGQAWEHGLRGGVPVFQVAAGYVLPASDAFHECGHAFDHMLHYWVPVPVSGPTWHDRFWAFQLARGVIMPAGTWDEALRLANALAGMAQWEMLPSERWAECFKDAMLGHDADALAFFRGLMYEARPALAPAPPPAVEGAKPVTIVVDYMNRHSLDWMTKLRQDYGATGIARYLTNRPGDPKCFSAAERDDAKAAGLEVHLVWETTGGSVAFNPGGASYFTPAMGIYDADQTHERLNELGAPMGIVVYFAVDVNIDPALTDAYFTAVERRAGTRFKVGAYGYERLCDFGRANWVNVGRHLWQTYGTPRGTLDLWQHLQDDFLGVQLDVNDANVQGWVLGDDDMMTQDQFNVWFDQRFAETPEYKNTVDAIKGVLGELAEATRKIAAGEAVDATAISDLKARVDKLRTI